MKTMNDFREERGKHYLSFQKYPLAFCSKEFGFHRRPNAVIPNVKPLLLGVVESFNIIEIRVSGGQYRVGCLQQVRYIDGDQEYGRKFKWFDQYDDRLSSLNHAKIYCAKFINGYEEAEEEHRQVGIDHYQKERTI